MNRLPVSISLSARAHCTADRARSRRDRTDAAADAGGGLRADRERALSRPAAAEPGRRRSADRNLHADAGGDRQGGCLHRLVSRPMQRLRHDGGYLDPDAAHEIFNAAPGILAWGAIRHEAQAVAGGYGPRRAGILPAARGRRAGSARMSASSRPTAASGAMPTARRRSAPSCSRSRAPCCTTSGRRSASRHRHGLLLVDDLFIPENFAAFRDEPMRCSRRDRSTGLGPAWSSAWALPRSRSAWRARRWMPPSICRAARCRKAQGDAREQRRAGTDRPHRGRLRAARAYLYATAAKSGAIWRAASHHRQHRIALRIAATWTIHQSASVVDAAYHMAGATAVFPPTCSSGGFATCTPSRSRSRPATPITRTPARRSCPPISARRRRRAEATNRVRRRGRRTACLSSPAQRRSPSSRATRRW